MIHRLHAHLLLLLVLRRISRSSFYSVVSITMVLWLPSIMICLSTMSIEMNGGMLRARTVRYQEVDMRGVEVGIPGVSTFLEENFLLPNKGLSTTTTIFGGLTQAHENGPKLKPKVRALQQEVDIDWCIIRIITSFLGASRTHPSRQSTLETYGYIIVRLLHGLVPSYLQPLRNLIRGPLSPSSHMRLEPSYTVDTPK